MRQRARRRAGGAAVAALAADLARSSETVRAAKTGRYLRAGSFRRILRIGGPRRMSDLFGTRRRRSRGGHGEIARIHSTQPLRGVRRRLERTRIAEGRVLRLYAREPRIEDSQNRDRRDRRRLAGAAPVRRSALEQLVVPALAQ